jgi:hypothetical protein
LIVGPKGSCEPTSVRIAFAVVLGPSCLADAVDRLPGHAIVFFPRASVPSSGRHALCMDLSVTVLPDVPS